MADDVVAADRSVTSPDDVGIDADTGHTDADGDERAPSFASRAAGRPVTSALLVGVLIVATLSGLLWWLGHRAMESRRVQQERELFLQVGRQGALNLTTIDYAEADADVRRILDGAIGTFYEDFQKRGPAFVDVVKQAQSKSVGSVTEAAVESSQGDLAQVLVAVTVKTTIAGAAEPQPRSWRMRIDLQKTNQDVKVSNVEFVP